MEMQLQNRPPHCTLPSPPVNPESEMVTVGFTEAKAQPRRGFCESFISCWQACDSVFSQYSCGPGGNREELPHHVVWKLGPRRMWKVRRVHSGVSDRCGAGFPHFLFRACLLLPHTLIQHVVNFLSPTPPLLWVRSSSPSIPQGLHLTWGWLRPQMP